MGLRETFGLNVRRARQRRGLSIEELAQEAELSYSYLGEIERGRRNPTLDVVEKLAQAVGEAPHRLLDPAQRTP